MNLYLSRNTAIPVFRDLVVYSLVWNIAVPIFQERVASWNTAIPVSPDRSRAIVYLLPSSYLASSSRPSAPRFLSGFLLLSSVYSSEANRAPGE